MDLASLFAGAGQPAAGPAGPAPEAVPAGGAPMGMPQGLPPSLIFAAAAQLNQMAAELAQSFGPSAMPQMGGPPPMGMPAGPAVPVGEPDGDEPMAAPKGKKPAPKAKKPSDEDGDEG